MKPFAIAVALTGALHAASLGAEPAPTVRLDDRAPFYELASDRKVGAKGEAVVDVSTPGGACGSEQWVFDHADLIIRDNRFGAAQFVALPEPGCAACEPIRIRWYHEPTGRLHFVVNVYRHRAVADCPEKPS